MDDDEELDEEREQRMLEEIGDRDALLEELDEEEGKQWIVFPYEEWWNNKTGEQRG